ncbi:MAG TPA: glycosyltransferase family 39 protein, partial [Anaerolineales bacterium]|nr:glycosyltransferase family 39 protein [Anaerolineales bacterium]
MLSTLSTTSEKLRPHMSEGAKIILSFFLIATAIIFVLHTWMSVAYRYSLDYGEAPLIDQAVRLAAGENIYRPDISTPPYTIANYPPLYVISLIPFLNWFDSPFHMARMISAIATLLSGLFISLITYTFSKNRLAALVAAMLFLASPYVVQWSGRARIDALALAFATGALFVFVRWPKERWGWFAGGLLLVAAAYTRQSYALAAPLAGFVWLWTKDKRHAIALALLVGGLGIALFLFINTVTDGGFYYNIVTANVNEFTWERLGENLAQLWRDNQLILVLSVLFLLIGWRSQKSWPLLAVFLVGAFLSALTIGKIGSNINYFLELAAALALVGGVLVVWSQVYPWRNVVVLLLIALQLGLLLRSSMQLNVDWILGQRYLDFNALQRLEQEVKRMDGPVLADEYMGLLTMNDRPLYLQPFELSQLAHAGMWDQQPLLEEIRNQNFDGILIHHFDTTPVFKERWTAEMLKAIDEYYRPVKTLAGTVMYIPLVESGISRVPAPETALESAVSPLWEEKPIPVGQAGFVSEVSITVDPTNPDQLAATTTGASKQDCEQPNCIVQLLLFTSQDGGETWQTLETFGRPKVVVDHGQVLFDPNGMLNILGIRDDVIVLNQSTLAENDLPTLAGF